jgi:hypothetical protein
MRWTARKLRPFAQAFGPPLGGLAESPALGRGFRD